MKYYYCFFVIFFALHTGCTTLKNPKLESVNTISSSGFTRTIKTKKELVKLEKENFLQRQPYQKVMVNYTPLKSGKKRSVIYSYHPNGSIKQKLEVENSKAYGKYLEWYDTGTLKIKSFIVGGLADLTKEAQNSWLFHGESLAFYQNQQKEAIINYQEGKLEGVCQRFTPQGNLISEKTFSNNIEDGPSQTFWQNGKKRSIEEYVDGLLIKGQYFSKQETLLSKVENKQGVRWLFKEDKSSIKEEIKQGVVCGSIEEISPSGKVKHQYQIDREKKHGREIYYYENGQKKLVFQWFQGSLEGPYQTFYENGQKKSIGEIKNHEKQNSFLAFYQNGAIMMVEEYDKGLLIKGDYHSLKTNRVVSKVRNGRGVVTLFSQEGIKTKTIDYIEGVPVE